MATQLPIQATDRLDDQQQHLFQSPGQQEPVEDFGNFAVASGPFLEYRKLVGNISEKLRKENVLRLAYIYELPAWYYEVGPTYDSSHSLRVLIALEMKGVFSPKNMNGLAVALKSIEREDLEKLVQEFIEADTKMNVPRQGRLNTHPQKTLRQTWSNYSLRNRPRPLAYQHSSSLTSIAAEGLFAEDESDGIHRTHSKPELDAAGKKSSHSPRMDLALQPTSFSKQQVEMGVGLRFALMSSRTLLKQLKQLQTVTTYSPLHQQSLPSQSVLTSASFKSLEEAVSAAQQLTSHIKVACQATGYGYSESEPPTSRSTPVHEWEPSAGNLTGRFRRCSSGGRVMSASGLSTQSSGVFMSPLTTQVTDSETRRQLDFGKGNGDIVEADGTKPTETDAQLSKPTDDIAPLLPEEMHRTISGMSSRKLSRKRSMKKLCRKGLLVWQLKVTKLREYLKQKDFHLESEDFFDNQKRKFRASLFPHGLGEDAGKYMTLNINCLDEPKSQSISNTEIVVSVLDPKSSTHPIQPITRTMERRGIRVVQQFISHRQVTEFQSNIVLLSIHVAAVSVSKQEESDDSAADTP